MPSNIFASITFTIGYKIFKVFIIVSMHVPIWTGIIYAHLVVFMKQHN